MFSRPTAKHRPSQKGVKTMLCASLDIYIFEMHFKLHEILSHYKIKLSKKKLYKIQQVEFNFMKAIGKEFGLRAVKTSISCNSTPTK